jgi:hypothetical protein
MRQRHPLRDVAGSPKPLRTDLYDVTASELVEAKGVSSREAVRMVLGQLLDHRRFVKPATLAALLPTRPTDDLIDLIRGAGAACIYEAGAGRFERLEPTAAYVSAPTGSETEAN